MRLLIIYLFGISITYAEPIKKKNFLEEIISSNFQTVSFFRITAVFHMFSTLGYKDIESMPESKIRLFTRYFKKISKEKNNENFNIRYIELNKHRFIFFNDKGKCDLYIGKRNISVDSTIINKIPKKIPFKYCHELYSKT
mgnify:CR=1 FL=1|jgi:hypothetical protein